MIFSSEFNVHHGRAFKIQESFRFRVFPNRILHSQRYLHEEFRDDRGVKIRRSSALAFSRISNTITIL